VSVSVRRRVGAAALLTAALSAAALPSQAAASDPLVVPKGYACDFTLQVDSTPSGHAVKREFTDANGNTVRTLRAGKGDALTFTNIETGATLALRSNGSVARTTTNKDGSSTVVSTGHNVLIFFPSDVPPGPRTTLYIGRVTYTTDSDGVFTFVSSSGQTRDICGELM